MDNFIAHILVVDDDDGIRSLVKKYLNENNYLVTTANSAEDAVEKIKIIEFDHEDVVRHPLVSKIIKAYQNKNIDVKN